VKDAIPEDVYVVVTVSVTPVGNVVILGVAVPTVDGEEGNDALAVTHRDTGGVRLDDTDFVMRSELV